MKKFMKRLIITADDYGMSEAVNRAIEEGVSVGFITSINVMVNMPYANDVAEVRRRFPDISIGLHLNLTAGKPVSNCQEIKSLVDSNGMFYSMSEFRSRWQTKKIKLNEVKKEISAQYLVYRRLIGEPDYWNTHQHIHMAPAFLYLILSSEMNLNIKAFRCNKHIVIGEGHINKHLRKLYINSLFYYVRKRVKIPDGLLLFVDENIKYNMNEWLHKVSWDKYEVIELMIHPAKSIDSIYFGAMQESRIKEYEMVINESNYRCIEENNVELIGFKDIYKIENVINMDIKI